MFYKVESTQLLLETLIFFNFKNMGLIDQIIGGGKFFRDGARLAIGDFVAITGYNWKHRPGGSDRQCLL